MLCLVVSLLLGCDQPKTDSENEVKLESVPLPALSRLDPQSRELIRNLHKRVTDLDPKTVPPLVLANSYGELGKLLNAYKFDDSAMISYRLAERLMPADYRWTYYQAHLYRQSGKPEIAVRGFARAVELMRYDVSVSPQQVGAAYGWLGVLTASP